MTDKKPATRAVVYYTATTALAILFTLPLVFLLGQSFHGPDGFGLDNYREVVHYGEGLGAYAGNTFRLAALTVAFTVVISAMGGYAFARLPFRGRNVLFLATLAILMVPYASLLLPLYILLGWLGLQNTIVGVALVMTTLQLPFSLFMMRNAFSALPREIEEAAMVDGCGFGRTFFRVLLPGVLPGTVTVALYAFLAGWNEFIGPLIFLSDGAKATLPVALVAQRSGTLGQIDFGALQAGVIIAALPCGLLFLLLQRYYVKGFSSGALKG
ncbi:Diacetylchitobiose uptake system permease protein DasC [Streptomyces sp. enrichment culture]|uniref:carbohydrate ABC transporter permease n=1 Tax=Streptomyces sp. enrichment culture TaxID=1795815 RepID=UPI003F57D02B